MTKHASGRDVSGILLFNKPVGCSSNAALQRVKRLFQARKAGHTGSLDNLASGLLPICLGEATKWTGFLLDADKHYRVEATLGATSTTGDAEGDIVPTGVAVTFERPHLETVMSTFVGTYAQIPPMYSALKYHGQSLYRLARRGQVIERQPRPVTIYAVSLLDFVDNHLTFTVQCSKGTYVRTLVEDLGTALGCGAYVSALQRTHVGIFKDMIDLATLEEINTHYGLAALDQLLLPMQRALEHLPHITVSEHQATALRHGQTVMLTATSVTGLIKLLTDTGVFLGIGHRYADGQIVPKRLLNVPLPSTIHPQK